MVNKRCTTVYPPSWIVTIISWSGKSAKISQNQFNNIFCVVIISIDSFLEIWNFITNAEMSVNEWM
jgi:3-deoxy-D-manno-octulosonic-acid transferase